MASSRAFGTHRLTRFQIVKERRAAVTRRGCLADGVSEGLKIITGWAHICTIGCNAHHLPTQGGRECDGVHIAEVVSVRITHRGQGAEDGGGVGVDVGQRGRGSSAAGDAGTATTVAHDE